MPLPEAFYKRPTLAVAHDLIGAVLHVEKGGRSVSGQIVEAEAYLGQDDAASHAAGGPTPRSRIMFGPPGVAYVYFIYGKYHCVNVVCEVAGTAGAVLIRALEPLTGLDLMARRRRRGKVGGRKYSASELCNGPGKLCQALGIDLRWNGLSLRHSRRGGRRLWLERGATTTVQVATTPRIGIRKAAALPYRFIATGSDCLSESRGRAARPV